MRDTSVLHDYPVVLGSNPTDKKLQEGDGCTPEGIFKIRDKYSHKHWTKFMWIDYPNGESWKKFNEAKRTGSISSTAQIGGEVGIHGVPAGMDHLINTKYNWTAGCISLKNVDVNAVYDLVKKETAVIIRK